MMTVHGRETAEESGSVHICVINAALGWIEVI